MIKPMSDKIDFKKNTIDKEGDYIIIKRSIKEDISLVNIYAVDIGLLQYIRETLTEMKRELNNNTVVVVGNFNTTPALNRPASREKINKET